MDPAAEAHFALIVSEKSGPQRREHFEASEITIGRVAGNDLVLPKGNVSKRHARILFREGRFIVTDLNSTNGTYVNRRRIAQATIIREDDRVYIGDFVLRVTSEQGPPESEGVDSESPTGIHAGPLQSVADVADVTVAPAGRAGEHLEVASASATLAPQVDRPRIPSAPVYDPVSAAEQLSRNSSVPGGASSNPPIYEGVSEVPQESSSRFADMASGHRRAVAAIVDAVLAEKGEPRLHPSEDFAADVRLEAEQVADRLLVAGQIPVGTSAEAVGDQAVDEILGLGPLADLLADPAVQMIAAARFDQLNGTRDGRQQPFPPGFSTKRTFEWALRRLCARSGEPISDEESLVERTLEDGVRISILRGAISPSGPILNVRKPRRIASTLDDLVRRGAVSRAMATFLHQCVSGALNLLIVGPRDEGAHVVLASLCSAASRDTVVAVTDFDELMTRDGEPIRLDVSHYAGDARRLLEVVATVPRTRLAVTLSNSDLAAATIEATGSGVSGLLASLHAANLSRGLLRLPADVVAERAGMSAEAAVGWVLSAFDVVLEVTRLRDGRIRVLRIGELAPDGRGGIQVLDIFRFVVSRVAAGGAVEGSFVPSGSVPRVASQLEAMGMRIDSSLFVRSPSR